MLGPRSVCILQRSFATTLLRAAKVPEPVKLHKIKADIDKAKRDPILTVPNVLTISRLVASPILGYLIVKNETSMALGLFTYSCITDFLDGYIARKYNKRSTLGSVLDPFADKTLMVTLTTCLAVSGAIPTWCAAIILGRDIFMVLAAFPIRYISLPKPKTIERFFDISIPSVEVRPTKISKYNTFFQMIYLGMSLAAPMLSIPPEVLYYLSFGVAFTTIWSGASYIYTKNALKFVGK